MKNTIKIKAIQRIAALILLATVIIIPVFAKGFFDKAEAGSGQGGLSITGLEKYNGMLISAEDGRLIKTNDGIITNGSATLNVTASEWNDDTDSFKTVSYTESNTLMLGFTITERKDPSKTIAEYYNVPVEFNNGIAKITYAEISNHASNN